MKTTATIQELKMSEYGKHVHYQLSAEVLVRQSLEKGQGTLSSTGVLCVDTGKFTGRSPKDKFTVIDDITLNTVDWGEVNRPISEAHFDLLHAKMKSYLSAKEVWVRDAYACADPRYRLNIRVVNETPWANLFCHHLFGRPNEGDQLAETREWLILQAPGFLADPETDGTRQQNFTAVSFSKKIILIGGTAYTGEMKKGVFSVLNYLLPEGRDVLSMHCSANEGKDGDVALFFGLSGTGKTTLSADPNRSLIGDDEHGWNNDTVFNFEGGCYAKCIDLSEDKEPQIYQAIRPGALVENAVFFEGTNEIDFCSRKITENTRVSYPISFITNALDSGMAGAPRNIFFLTCDAYGVLPPISKLTPGQAMYQFISGYTAKIAGTETGINEPKATFSACFAAPFLPLHPGFYAKMLGEKMKKHQVNVWMVNTGWIGGGFGTGTRIKLRYTRALVTAALKGQLDRVPYEPHPVFKVAVPGNCPGIPDGLLNPRCTWTNKEAYDQQAQMLARLFASNFEKYTDFADNEILLAAPLVV
jgi:phosphoenolpyruvate carboxykinase (ATP)